MTDLQRTARVAEIQSYLRTQPTLRLEFLASISRLFREHDIEMSPEVLSGLTLTLERKRNGYNNGNSSNGSVNGNARPQTAMGPPPAPTTTPPPAPTTTPPPAPTIGEFDAQMGPPPAPTTTPPPAPTTTPPPAPTIGE